MWEGVQMVYGIAVGRDANWWRHMMRKAHGNGMYLV